MPSPSWSRGTEGPCRTSTGPSWSTTSSRSSTPRMRRPSRRSHWSSRLSGTSGPPPCEPSIARTWPESSRRPAEPYLRLVTNRTGNALMRPRPSYPGHPRPGRSLPAPLPDASLFSIALGPKQQGSLLRLWPDQPGWSGTDDHLDGSAHAHLLRLEFLGPVGGLVLPPPFP